MLEKGLEGGCTHFDPTGFKYLFCNTPIADIIIVKYFGRDTSG